MTTPWNEGSNTPDGSGADFASNVMPAGGGRLALSVSRAMMKAAGISVGEAAEVEIVRVGR